MGAEKAGVAHLVAMLIAVGLAWLAIDGHRWWVNRHDTDSDDYMIDNPSPPPPPGDDPEDPPAQSRSVLTRGADKDPNWGRLVITLSDESRAVFWLEDGDTPASLAAALIDAGAGYLEISAVLVKQFGMDAHEARRVIATVRGA